MPRCMYATNISITDCYSYTQKYQTATVQIAHFLDKNKLTLLYGG